MAQVFRRSAVEKLSSPEQLDKAIVITPPGMWAAIAGSVLIAAAVVFWALFGSLPETVSAYGAVVPAEGADCILSAGTGAVSEFCVEPGDEVAPGDVVARVVNPAGVSRDILSDRSGTVSMLLCGEGEAVTAGAELLRITPQTGERAVVFYVPVSRAQQLRAGMKAVITDPGSSGGRIDSSIISVSSGAVSVENMELVLGSGNGMSEVFASSGPVCSVICSVPQWYQPASGTMVSGRLLIRESAPIFRLLSDIRGAAED